MKLLIVEDNTRMRKFLKLLLGDLATQIEECADGAEALRAYEAHRPDWVLMDIRMKETDGIAATREIKAAHPEARICIVTDYDDPNLREAAKRAGAREYVVKDNLIEVRANLRLEPRRRITCSMGSRGISASDKGWSGTTDPGEALPGIILSSGATTDGGKPVTSLPSRHSETSLSECREEAACISRISG